jgi:hypothetical protein
MDNENSLGVASRLFRRITYTVIKLPSEARIEKGFVVSLHGQYNIDNKIKNLFINLIDLFGNRTEIPSIVNMGLNNCVLKNMSTTMPSDIFKASEMTVTNIQRRLYIY